MGITSKNPDGVFLLFSFIFISFWLSLLCDAANTIKQGQNITDGQNQTLISQGQQFELGFFSPKDSSSRYVGIWYYNIPEESERVVWVANRGSPISDKSGVLTIGEDGNLMVLDENNKLVWSTNVSITSKNTTALLDNSGILVLSRNDSIGDPRNAYWNSFDDPTDTFLPGMRVEVNSERGENRAFTSWKSATDPSKGDYSMGVDPRGAPQIVIWEGQNRRWRSGHWDGRVFTGVPNMTGTYMYGFKLSVEDGSRYFTYIPLNSADKSLFRIRWDGYEEQLRWEEGENKWGEIQSLPSKTNECEDYNKCGDFAVCRSESDQPMCSCLRGFDPRDEDQWNKGNWSGGCMRRTLLQCDQMNSTVTNEKDGEDGFSNVRCTKLPDFADVESLGSDETCEKKCLQNCSCTAYADVNGIGCMIWRGDLVDVHHFPGGGNTLQIRLAHADLGGGSKISTAVIIIIVVVGVVLLGVFICILWRFRAKLKVLPTSSISWFKESEIPIYNGSKSKEFSTDLSGPVDLLIEGDQANGPELPMFNFSCVDIATNNFSEENKLGEGGFGPVYKGKLPGGQEIAVKRLARRSGQGLEEFKNEVILIAKLQHRNLVRLLGCCIQGEEKLLLYEYMPNKSLDGFLFDTARQALLDWRKRFTIIEGIARGLLYLHRDSRLRIIHRDLKASNILLDEDMNPKISDFGMARIFGGNQHEANTNRVVGTYGYMSPEYAMEGLFSVKSDVYSFGVLLLEILSGRRNTSFRLSEYSSLIGHAWNLWNREKAMELIDPSIRDSCSEDEALRCIQIGMLCVQDTAVQRPTMSSVVLMLESEAATLPLPRQPTFTSMRGSSVEDTESYVEGHEIVSLNDMTVTMVFGR